MEGLSLLLIIIFFCSFFFPNEGVNLVKYVFFASTCDTFPCNLEVYITAPLQFQR